MFSLQIACAEASVAWPQRSTSTAGVNQRSDQPLSRGDRNAVSARFISAATLAIQRSSRAPSMKQTAAGFPLNGSLVKASIWRRRIGVEVAGLPSCQVALRTWQLGNWATRQPTSSESLHLGRLRVHPADEQEADDDHAGQDAVADAPVRAVHGRVVVADHQENQLDGHVAVLA